MKGRLRPFAKSNATSHSRAVRPYVLSRKEQSEPSPLGAG